MGRPRVKEYDPFIELLLTYGTDGYSVGFKDITEACTKLNIARQRIYAVSERGITDVRKMGELAAAFGVPKAVFQLHISQYAGDIYDQHSVSSKAS